MDHNLLFLRLRWSSFGTLSNFDIPLRSSIQHFLHSKLLRRQHKFTVLSQRSSYLFSHLLPSYLVECYIFQQLMIIKWTIWCFYRIRQRNHDSSQKYCSCCGLLKLGNFEWARIVPKHFCMISKQFGEHSAFIVVSLDDWKLWAINKNVLFCGVAMKV